MTHPKSQPKPRGGATSSLSGRSIRAITRSWVKEKTRNHSRPAHLLDVLVERTRQLEHRTATEDLLQRGIRRDHAALVEALALDVP